MRLNRADTIAGRPALETRGLLRRIGPYDAFTRADFARWQALTPRQAARRVHALAAEGYLAPEGTDPDGRRRWKLTRKAFALRMANATPPITRATAERLVAGVLERARALADWDAHPYARRVAELVVFGSYLRPEVDRLGDVDLAARWEPRFADPDAQYEYGRARARAAWKAGRNFRSFLAELSWPDVEVRRYLMGRSPAVSLHDLEANGDFVRSVPHQPLFELAP